MVIRPKSIATVLVVLRSTPPRSSTSVPAAVNCSSVRRGLISLTAPTRVVLPTPKPPATRIFRARSVLSEGAKPMDDLLEDVFVREEGGRDGSADPDVLGVQQVTEQHPDHAERQVEVGGDLGDGQCVAPADLQDGGL